MANPTGESESDAVRLDFDRRLMLQFRGCRPDVRTARERAPVPPASSSFGSNGYFAPATGAPQVMAPVSGGDLSSAPPCRLIIASCVPWILQHSSNAASRSAS